MRIEPGRIAVVTGGASGIGFALAAAAAGHGMHVCWPTSAPMPWKPPPPGFAGQEPR